MKKPLEIKLKYSFGDRVTHRLGGEELMVVSLQINADKRVTYGCTDSKGDYKWLKDFELKPIEDIKIKGFTLRLKR